MQKTLIDQRPPIDTYLDFVNNFLTIERMSEYYGVNAEYLRQIIETGKINNRYQSFVNYLTSKK